MPETHLASPPKMIKPAIKSLKVPTLLTSSLRRRFGCSSPENITVSSPSTIRRKQPKLNNKTKKKNQKTVTVSTATTKMFKQRKVLVVTKIASSIRNRRQPKPSQHLYDLDAPATSPSPISDSTYPPHSPPDSSSDSSFTNRSQLQGPARSSRHTSPGSTSSLDFDSVFRIPHSESQVFGARYQHRAPRRTPEEVSEILQLQSNFLMGGLVDRFKDWRLDTDHMTYEQLLALGDKMGYVSKGLKESEINRCVKNSKFLGKMPSHFTEEAEPKCTVCQEDYELKDKLGLLVCGHSYHRNCIKEWLKHKKTCPVCKSEVISSWC